MIKPESFPIDKIYVPVKRRKTLKSEMVQEIAESIMEVGQQDPILVRPDESRFVLVEGLHRLEACKALGEKTIMGLLVSADVAHQMTPLSHNAQAELEHQKILRLRKLRLQKEAAEKLAVVPKADTEPAKFLREGSKTHNRNNLKATPSKLDRKTSESASRTLSDWLTQQARSGGRY